MCHLHCILILLSHVCYPQIPNMQEVFSKYVKLLIGRDACVYCTCQSAEGLSGHQIRLLLNKSHLILFSWHSCFVVNWLPFLRPELICDSSLSSLCVCVIEAVGVLMFLMHVAGWMRYLTKTKYMTMMLPLAICDGYRHPHPTHLSSINTPLTFKNWPPSAPAPTHCMYVSVWLWVAPWPALRAAHCETLSASQFSNGLFLYAASTDLPARATINW